MKKKNFKKPLLVCLSVLTLFSASATSIASSVIDNQPTVVHRVKRVKKDSTYAYRLSYTLNGKRYEHYFESNNSGNSTILNAYFDSSIYGYYLESVQLSDSDLSTGWFSVADDSTGLITCNGERLKFNESGCYDLSINQSGEISVVKKSNVSSHTVDGVFSESAGMLGSDNYTIGYDIRPLTYDQPQLDGNSLFAVVFTNISEKFKSNFTNLKQSYISNNLPVKQYFLDSNGINSLVLIFDSSDFDIDDTLTLDFTSPIERGKIEMSELVNELNDNVIVYGGYFGSNTSAIITVDNIPGMGNVEEEEDISGPLISGSQKTYTTSVDNPISVEIIKSALTAHDDTDGNVTNSIIVKSDNYTNNCHTLGTYNIVFAAYDKAGNESTLTVAVVVQDVVDPVIEGPDTLTLSYANPKTLEDIKSQYTVTDNYDTEISIEVDAQSPNYDGTKVGTYSITLKATDSSNHVVRKTITVNVIDDVKPVFSGASSFVTNNATSASLDDVMANCNVKAVDEISGNCEVRIKSETLTGNADKVGNYEVIYEATDAAGNTAEFKVTISITDGIPPVFYIDNSIIYAANDIMMTNVDLCNLMIATCEIDASKPYSLSITDTDGYLAACAEGEEVALGDYEVTATVSYKDGNKDVYTKTISVYDAETSDIETKEVKLNFFEAIGQFFKNCKAAWDEGGFKLWWQKFWNGDLFKENMTKIVEVEKEVETVTSETSGK